MIPVYNNLGFHHCFCQFLFHMLQHICCNVEHFYIATIRWEKHKQSNDQRVANKQVLRPDYFVGRSEREYGGKVIINLSLHIRAKFNHKVSL